MKKHIAPPMTAAAMIAALDIPVERQAEIARQLSLGTAWRVVHGHYQVPEGATCRGCGGAADRIDCYPGAYPRCRLGCGAILLYLGRVPSASCVSPNGRIDGHMSYVRGGFPGVKMTCAFCTKES